ncbi:MAG: hypothetical protein ACU826_08040 [Gammaproteobacteria bacterium]
MKRKQLLINSFLGMLGFIFSTVLWAHGGAKGTDTDQCKIEIQGEWVHYTAYQPFISPGEEYCATIPEVNTPTHFVFDYIGVKLRHMKVEFEITKEPEGTRVFYKEPTEHQSGTVDASVTLTEPGSYLIHVTLTPEVGEKVDAHIGFNIGGGKPTSTGQYGLYLLFIFAALYIFYLSHAGFKQKVNELLGKAKDI